MHRKLPFRGGALAPLALGACAALVIAACSDVTSPVVRATSGVASAVTAGPTTVVVAPEDMKGWTFVHAINGKDCAAPECRMVSGPGTPPVGRGSAELSATNGSESSLHLAGYQGVRLDRVTALGYATYRAAGDSSAAGIALELVVDFNLNGGGAGDIGTLVYQPPAGAPAGTWRAWDARAGQWFLRRQSANSGIGNVLLPCVESRPCGWAELLQRYPDIGIHGTGGAIQLTARRADGFRGNVDSLVVGVDGSNTVYDFELVARRNQYVLSSLIQDGAVIGRFPADTLFDEGSVVPYSFTPRAGRADLVLVMDDSLWLPPSGQIVMNGRHHLKVVSDTLYTYDALSPLEKGFADYFRALLSSADKEAAYGALNGFIVGQLNAGVDADVLAHAEQVAQYVVIDPVRDADAMDAVDAALTGLRVDYQRGWDQLYSSTSRNWPRPPSASPSRVPATGGGLQPGGPSNRSLTPGSGPAATDRGSLPDENDPRERTEVLFMNGIFTPRGGAASATAVLANMKTGVYSRRGFDNGYTHVDLFYNPWFGPQIVEWVRAHPCFEQFLKESQFISAEGALTHYLICTEHTLYVPLFSFDLWEAATARAQILAGMQPTNPEVVQMASAVAGFRAEGKHVMLVGHSEGSILEAQAIGQLPALEGHPLEVANRCVTAFALAPAIRRENYGMDDYHVLGLLADNDIIHITAPGPWQPIQSSLTREADKVIADSPIQFRPLLRIWYGVRIHFLSNTYLSSEMLPTVLNRLTQEHRECVAGTADLVPSSSTVDLGNVFTGQLTINNQNGRQLFGRTVQVPGGYAFDRVDTMTFRAMVPNELPWQLAVQVADNWGAIAKVTIPVIGTDYSMREDDLWYWDWIGGSNVVLADGTNVTYDGPIPTDPWDGSEGECNTTRTYTGSAGTFATFRLMCARVYNPVYTRPDNLPTGRPLTASYVHWKSPAGVADSAYLTPKTPAGFYLYCGGGARCIGTSYLEHLTPFGVAERSAVVGPSPNIVSHNLIAAESATRAIIATGKPAPRPAMRNGWMLDGKPFQQSAPTSRGRSR